jgi:putative acyl-CoA dehydrogenase
VIDLFLATRAPGGASSAWGSHYGTLSGTVSQAAARKVMHRAMVTEH